MKLQLAVISTKGARELQPKLMLSGTRNCCVKKVSRLLQRIVNNVKRIEIFAKYINVSFPCYFLGCGDTPFEIRQIPFTGVEITSTNYPSIHPNNVACSNVVRLNKGQRVRLTFLDFELEGSEGKWLVAVFIKYAI